MTKKKKSGTVLTFFLSAAAPVRFALKGPGPECAAVGSFTVQGKRGINHYRFKGRIHRVPLDPGMYRIEATVLRSGVEANLRPILISVLPPSGQAGFVVFTPPTCSVASVTAGAFGAATTPVSPAKPKHHKSGVVTTLTRHARRMVHSAINALRAKPASNWVAWTIFGAVAAAVLAGSIGLLRFLRQRRAAGV